MELGECETGTVAGSFKQPFVEQSFLDHRVTLPFGPTGYSIGRLYQKTIITVPPSRAVVQPGGERSTGASEDDEPLRQKTFSLP